MSPECHRAPGCRAQLPRSPWLGGGALPAAVQDSPLAQVESGPSSAPGKHRTPLGLGGSSGTHLGPACSWPLRLLA